MLVAQGLQESLKTQSDRLTAAKESFKLLMTTVANEGFKIAAMDLQAAFLLSKVLDSEILMSRCDENRIDVEIENISMDLMVQEENSGKGSKSYYWTLVSG